jgi:hypothetical protein
MKSEKVKQKQQAKMSINFGRKRAQQYAPQTAEEEKVSVPEKAPVVVVVAASKKMVENLVVEDR